MSYRIIYSPGAKQQLHALTARQQRIVVDAVDTQLRHQPLLETRNRKSMRSNPLAPWVLRVGNLRVYYDVGDRPECVVFVCAIGVKQRNRVIFEREEFEL